MAWLTSTWTKCAILVTSLARPSGNLSASANPTNAAIYLRLDSLIADGRITLTFGATSNHTYTLQHTDTPASGLWSKFAEVPARATDHTETILDPDAATNRFYRLVTPRQP